MIKQDFPKYADHVYREQKIDIQLIIKQQDSGFKSVTLPLVTVAAEWMTVDIIKTFSDSMKQDLKFQGVINENDLLVCDTLAVLPNSNNRGYCRVVLDSKSLDHFSEYLSQPHINKYDRCYILQILFDHIKIKKFTPRMYL